MYKRYNNVPVKHTTELNCSVFNSEHIVLLFTFKSSFSFWLNEIHTDVTSVIKSH